MPPAKTPVPAQAAPIYRAYLDCLAARGVGNKTFDSGARCFLARYPDPRAWAGLPLEQRLASTRPHLQPVLNFLMLHGHLRPGYDYLLDRKLTVILREAAASPLGPDLKRFLAGAQALGYSERARTGMASQIAVRMLIQTGRGLGELSDGDFAAFGQAITEREERLGRELKHYHGALYAARAVVYHLGAPAEPAPKRSTLGRWSWERHLDGVTDQVRKPMTGYLERLARRAGPLLGAGCRVRAGAFRPVPGPARPGTSLDGPAGPPAAHRAVPEPGRVSGQPPHRGADRRLHRQAAHPDGRLVPGRDHRVGLARGPGPAAGLPPRRAQAAAPAAPLPASRPGKGAAGGAGELAEPAARRRAAAPARHRDADRRAHHARAGLRARGPRLRRLAEGAAGQAAHRADGADRRRDGRDHRPDHRAPVAGPAAAPSPHREDG